MIGTVTEGWRTANRLLLERNFTIISPVKDYLKCVLCRNFLYDTILTNCGCNFCKRCFDEYVDKGGTKCPGNTELCQYGNLSNIMVDNRANRQISELIVECDMENCEFQCKLFEMEAHLGQCLKKKMSCPFSNDGCREREISKDKINEHLQNEIYSHNQLLIEMITSLRREIKELKETNQYEIQMLKENIFIDKNERKVIERENTKLKDEIKLLKEFRAKNEREINDLWEYREENKREIDLLKTNEEKNKKEMEILREVKEMSRKMNEFERYFDMKEGIFVWYIGAIRDLETDNWIYSDYFYCLKKSYKMGLRFINKSDLIYIQLVIYDNPVDEGGPNLEWPFCEKVTIRIVDKLKRFESQSFTQICVVNNPKYNHCEWSCPFVFCKTFLRGFIEGISNIKAETVIECLIDFNPTDSFDETPKSLTEKIIFDEIVTETK